MSNVKKKNNVWKVVAVVIGIIVYICLLVYISSKQSDYAVVLSTEKESYEFSQNDNEYLINVKIQNNANRMLGSAEDLKFFLSYHVYNLNGEVLAHDNIRSPFEKNIYSGEKGETVLHMTPLEKGEYIIGIDVLQEGETWFDLEENTEIKVRLTVK